MSQKKLFLTALAIAGLLLMPIASHGFPILMNGYLVLGENVVVTPWNLHPGDDITLTNQNGKVVFERKISRQTTYSPLNIPDGVYQLSIIRNGQIISSYKVPVRL